MGKRVAEHAARGRLFGPKVRFRVDLHGVSRFGPGDERTMIRWEWITEIVDDGAGVVVRSHDSEVVFPSGAFGLASTALAERLSAARAIERRTDVIGELDDQGPSR